MNTHSQHTNFKEHQRQARKNSRRLTIAFIVGIFLSANAYFWATWLILGHLGAGRSLSTQAFPSPTIENSSMLSGQLIISMIVSLISIGVIGWGYLQKQTHLEKKTADAIARLLGAQRLPTSCNLRLQQYTNIVEEMAIASGLHCPLILYLPNDYSINAFVTGGYDDSVAITVSQGALDYLQREELQALIAHEFGHIFNRDVFLNNRLTSVLHGFFYIKELIIDDDHHNHRVFSAFRPASMLTPNIRFGIFGIFTIVISSVAIFFGKLLKAAFSRQREWLADAHAVEYTRNKDALVGVLSKATALQHMQVETPTVSDESTHFLFINYQNKWLSTHPPIEARMLRYGTKMYQDELEALVYKLKQKKLEQKQVEFRTNQEHMIRTASTMLGLSDNDTTSKNKTTSQQNTVVEKFIPLLVIREYQKSLYNQPISSPESAANAVLAQFIALSKTPLKEFSKAFQWSSSKTNTIQDKIDALSKAHPSTHIQTFLHQLPALRAYKNKQDLIKYINAIIKSDKSFNLCEMSYLLCLLNALQRNKTESSCKTGFKRYIEEIEILLNTIAYISHEEEKNRKINYNIIKNDIIPTSPKPYKKPSLDSHTVRELYNSIRTLTNLKSTYRKVLISTIEKNMLLDDRLSTEQNHLLCALKRMLGQ